MWQRETAHDEELEHVVEACGVAHASLHDRAYVLGVAQRVAAQHALPRLHPCAVATYGVYLAVVCE